MLLGATPLAACALAPSRAPLGGNYAQPTPEVAENPKQKPPDAPATPASDDDETAKTEPPASSASSASPITSASPPSAPSQDTATLRYDPLKAGERVHMAVQLSIDARVDGMPADMGAAAMKIDAKAKVDIKIEKASAQALEQLEVTFTPLSMHTEFNGQGSDSSQDPPSVYDVSASGSSPKIVPRSGKLEREDRLTLLLFLAPLLEFHQHWGPAPTLTPTAGYHASIPLSAPAFMTEASDKTKLGPLVVRFDGPRTSERTPFELALPLEVSTDFGKFSVALTGSAELGAKARPISTELAGPCTGNVDPNGAVSIRGDAKISAKLSYD